MRKFYELEGNTPRLALIVYYLSQFWPLANQLINNVTHTWKMAGWAVGNLIYLFIYRLTNLGLSHFTGSQCHSAPVRLQSLSDRTEILPEWYGI